MADPIIEKKQASSEASPLAQMLLQTLKSQIDFAKDDEQPAYRVMLSELRNSAEKSVILRNVRALVKDLEPKVRELILRNLDMLEQRLLATTEFANLREEIQELKVAVNSAQEPKDLFIDEPGKTDAKPALSATPNPSEFPYEEELREDAGVKKIPAPTPLSLPDEELPAALKNKASEKPTGKSETKADATKIEKKDNAASGKTDVADRRGGNIPESAAAAKQDSSEKNAESSLYDPRTWSREDWIKAGKYTGVFAVGAGVVYGAARFARWFFGGAKKGAEIVIDQTKRGVQRSVNFGILGVGLLAGGIAAAVGFGKFEDFKKWIKNGVKEEVKKGIEEGKEKIKEEAGKGVTAVKKAAGSAKEEAQKKVESTKEKVVTKVTSTRDKLSPSPVVKKVAEVAPEAKESVARNAKELALSKLTNDKGPTMFAQMQKEQWSIGRMLQLYDPSTGKVTPQASDVIGKLIPDNPDAQERQRYIDAAAGIIVFCGKHADAARAAHERKRIDNPKLPVFEDQLLQGYFDGISKPLEFFQHVTDSLKSGNIDIKAVVQDLRPDALMESMEDLSAVKIKGFELPEYARGVAMTDLYRSADSGSDESKHWTQKTIDQYLASPINKDALQAEIDSGTKQIVLLKEELAKKKSTATEERDVPSEEIENTLTVIRQEIAKTEARVRERRAELALRSVCEFMVRSAPDLVPLFHEVLPDREWDNDPTKNAEAVRSYIRGMQMQSVLRWFMYRRMIASEATLEQSAGLIAQQLEVLDLIEKKDLGWKVPLSEMRVESLKVRQKEAIIRMAENLNNKEFREALTASLGLPPLALVEACKALQEPALQLAKAAAGVAVGPITTTAETYLALLKVFPKITTGVTAVGGLFVANAGLRTPAEFATWWVRRLDPQGFASKLSKARVPLPWEIRDKAINKAVGAPPPVELQAAGNMLKTLEEDIGKLGGTESKNLFKNLSQWLRDGAKDTTMQTALIDPVQAELTRVQAELRAAPLPSTPAQDIELKRLARLETQLEELHGKLQEFHVNDSHAPARNALAVAARPMRERLNRFYWTRDVKRAGLPGNLLWGAGVGLQAYEAYGQYKEIDAVKADKTEHMRESSALLGRLATELRSNPDYIEKKSEGATQATVFVHKESGVEVDLTISEKQLSGVGDAFDDRINAQRMRASASAAGAAGLLIMGPRLAMGPAGWVSIGVQVAVRTGVNAYEQSKMRTFIASSPAWVLAALGTEQTTKDREYDWLRRGSSWMISDLWPQNVKLSPKPGLLIPGVSFDISPERDKATIQHKMLFAIFMQDLRRDVPELLQEILGSVETPQQVDALFVGDFQKLIIPLISVCLYEQTSMSWDQARAIDVDSGLMVVPPNATLVELRRAIRSAALLYVQHDREQQYRTVAAKSAELVKNGEDDVAAAGAPLLAALGSRRVFGTAIDQLSLSPSDPRTLTQRLVDQAERSARKNEKGKAITNDILPGLPQAVALKDFATLAKLTEDNVQRERLLDVHAETTDETEGKVRPGLEEILTKKFWLIPDGKTLDRSQQHLLVLGAASNVREALKLPRVGEGLSADAAEKDLTQSAVEMFSKRGEQPNSVRDDELARKLYGEGIDRPLVFSRLKPRLNVASDEAKLRALCATVSRPRAKDEAFALKNVRAVYFEGEVLPNGHKTVLATFVYGEAGKEKSAQVVQQGAATSAIANAEYQGAGQAIALSSGEFLRQKGAQAMLKQTRDTWEKDRPQREALAKLSQEKKAQQEATEATRIKTEKEQMLLDRKAAQAKAKEKPGTLFKDPEGRWYVGYHRDHGFIYIQPPDSSTAPAFTTREASRDKSYTIVEYKDKRYKLDPLYVTKIEQQTDISADVINQVLVMPIVDKPEESAEKVLTVFVKNMHTPDSAKILRSVLGLYKQLQTDDQRRLFLSDLRARMYAETRVEGEETKQVQYLSKKTFDAKILPALIKRVSSAGRERRAA